MSDTGYDASWQQLCECGHIYDEHLVFGGQCDVDDCDCQEFHEQ